MAQQEKRFQRLGEQIVRLVRSLAAAKGWNMTSSMMYISQCTHYGPDMVHRWRQGKICPSPEMLEILARIGKEDASLPREWGESLLNVARYPDTTTLVNTLWGPKVIRSIPYNLPSRDRDELIGRQSEIARLLELLTPQHAAHLITVDGIGGVGKTALVLEVAYRCLKISSGEEFDPKVPPFGAIIFVSAKQQYLTPEGIFQSNEAKRTLRDIMREIASTLNYLEIMHSAPQEQFFHVRKALSNQRTLLIVDNLETMEDKQEIMSFLYELPSSVKVVITTRERILLFSPIRLDQLPQEEALNLIEREAREKEAAVSQTQALRLYNHIGGIPAALVYAVGQIASGFSLETVIERVPKVKSDVARFCFEGSLEPLRGQAAHYLLMAIAMFSKPPVREALVHTAGLTRDQIRVEEGLAQLRKLSLIREQGGRYSMLPLTREYALSELAARPSFEQEARAHWVEWYKDYTKKYGKKDWDDWNVLYDRIEEEWENLLTVFDWCAIHERYDDIRYFWQERQLVKFAKTYGYWDDRLFWLEWLIQSAEKRGDWSNAVKAIVDLGSIFTLMGQFEEADRHLKKAWGIHQYIDPQVRLFLTQTIAELRIRQKIYHDALEWLNRAEVLLDEIIPTLGEPERTRRWVDYQSRRGFLFYHMKDYERAELYYLDMLNQAEAIGWHRPVGFAQNHLAYIAIAEDELEKAESLLQTGLPVDKDKRLTAFHKYVLAYFHQKKGVIDEARQLAQEALDDFESLGMKPDAQEVEELLQQLNP